jgi:hypothetical protein
MPNVAARRAQSSRLDSAARQPRSAGTLATSEGVTVRGDGLRKNGNRVCKPLDVPDDNCNNATMSKSTPQPTLTDVLRATIERSGLTVYRIGKATGIDTANLGRFVRGKLSIRLDKADRLAACLGLRLTPDPGAKPPEPTPENLARPMLAKTRAKRKVN